MKTRPTGHARWSQRWLAALGVLASALGGGAGAQGLGDGTAARGPGALPPEVRRSLQQAGVPPEALGAVVLDLNTGQTALRWQDGRAQNPASLMKLLTTAAALERLGPAWTWSTPVWLTGPVNQGVLEGSVLIQGRGDPKFTTERVWTLLRRLQQWGVRSIRGDIVLDSTAFEVPEGHAADFDGEALRPYNVRPAALLAASRSVAYTFVPDPATGVARVLVDPPLARTDVERTVPLAPPNTPCGDWRTGLKATIEPGRARFSGRYAASCGEQAWALADPQPTTFEARLIEGLWRELGGTLEGRVREGVALAGPAPQFELRSPPLAEAVRDINKLSQNLMAQQLFLTLALQARPDTPATPAAARELLRAWLVDKTGPLSASDAAASSTAGAAALDEVVIDNGSGLSRDTRLSPRRLATLLAKVYDSPVMSELMSSLPISGIDGTLRRSRMPAGRAHLKTGSLRDVSALGGYVLAASGKRYVLVAMVNHPQAGAARPALDALVQWVLRDAPAF